MIGQARHTEVGEPGMAVAVDEDVLRLDVAMHDAAAMGVLERGEDLHDPLGRPAGGRTPRAARRAERRAVDELPDQVDQLGAAAPIQQAHDVRVLESLGSADLDLDARQQFGRGRDGLDGDRAAGVNVLGDVDRGGCTTAHEAAEPVAAQRDIRAAWSHQTDLFAAG